MQYQGKANVFKGKEFKTYFVIYELAFHLSYAVGELWTTSAPVSGFIWPARAWAIFLKSGPRGNAREISPAREGLNPAHNVTLIRPNASYQASVTQSGNVKIWGLQ